MKGRGIFSWPDGRSYEGDFVNNHRHGQGRLTWEDGHYYDGEWHEGQQHG